MKKIICLLLCFCVCLVFICSCAKNGEILEINISNDDMGISCPTNVFYRDRQNAFLKQTEFIEVPEYITVTIENIASKYPDFRDDIANCEAIFIEKNYDKLYDRYVTKSFGNIYQPIIEGENGRWEQIPFEFDGESLRKLSPTKLMGIIYLENHLTSEYEFTPGTYRVVFRYSDGSRDYAYFAIYA